MENPRVNPRFSPNNVLFTTDFSSASRTALPYARALARWYGSKIFVCHVVHAAGHDSGPLSEQNVARHQAEQSMNSFLQNSPLADVVSEIVIEQGDLWEALAQVIKRHKIDLIVLGTHGRHGIKKLTLGSVAEMIFHHAPCPVWVVGPGVTQRPFEFESLKRILFATDFSASSLHAFPYALSLAEENEASIILLHLIPLMPLDQSPASVLDASRKRLEAVMPAEAKAWCTPEFVVESEFPLQGILRVATEKNADLIVMGLRQPETLAASGHIPWVTASEVARQAHCPLLTVRG
jgi:nucleotide-binding universal stress UspA family protein